MKNSVQTNSRNHLRRIVVTAMFCSISFLLTFVLRFNVGFLTFDVKDTVLAILSLMYGPVYGVVSSLTVALIEFLSISDTGIYGFIMNFLASATFTFTCGLIYKYKRNFSGAIISLVSAAVTLVCVMLAANLFITPYYMGVDRTTVIGMIPTMLLPFNLCKALINAAVTLIIYKPITGVLKKSGILQTVKTTEDTKTAGKKSLRSALLVICCLVVIALSVLFILLKMEGTFNILK